MKKGLKITLIAIVALIVVAGASFAVVYATQGDYVKNKFAMLTKDNKEYLQWVNDKNSEKTAEQLKAIGKNLSKGEKMTSNTSVLISASKEFGDLVGLEDFAGIDKAGFKFGSVVDGKYDTEISLAPMYKDVDILKLAFRMDLDNKEFYVAAPTYKSDLIDLSEYFNMDLSSMLDENAMEGLSQLIGGNSSDVKDAASIIKALIDTFNDKIEEATSDTSNDDKLADLKKSIEEIFYDSFDEVELQKDQSIEVNGIEAECNTLSLSLKKKDMIKLSKALVKCLVDSMGDLGEDTDKTIDQVVNELDKAFDQLAEASTKLALDYTLYVNNKGEVIGGEIRMTVADVKVKVEYLIDAADEKAEKVGMNVSVNGVKALSIYSNTYVDADGYDCSEVELKPGSMISQFLNNKKYVLDIITKVKDTDELNDSLASIKLVDKTSGSTDLLTLDILADVKYGVTEFSTDKGSQKVIAASELLTSDYIDAKALVQMIIDKLKAINDDNLNNFLSAQLAEQGLGTTDRSITDTLQDLIDSGYLDMIAGMLPIGGETGLSSSQSSNNYYYDNDGNRRDAYGNQVDENGNVIDPEGSLGILPDDNDPNGINQWEEEDFDISSMTFEPEKNANGDFIYNYDFLKNLVMPVEYKGIEYVSYDDKETTLESAEKSFISDMFKDSFFPAEENDVIEYSDMVTFDLIGKDGKTSLDEYTFTDQEIQVGNYQLNTEVDDGMIGLGVGDKFRVNLTLDGRFGDAADYNGEFVIKITEIKKFVMPEWTEEYLVDRLGFESLEDAEQYVSDHIDEYTATSDLDRYNVFFKVEEKAEFREASENTYQRFAAWLDNYYMLRTGMTMEDYYNDVFGAYGDLLGDDGEYSIRDLNATALKDSALVAYIADAEGISVTQDEVDAYLLDLCADENMTLEQISIYIPQWYAINSVIEDKVYDVVLQYAVRQ